MDRNIAWHRISEDVSYVALRKESVDRNNAVQVVIVVMNGSLSARRAWIEMALLELIPLTDPSLSARRAWIEIYRHISSAFSCRRRSPQGERG